MDNNFTVGSVVPVQDTSVQISQKKLEELVDSIKNIEKRLENIEKLLSEIQQSSDEVGEEKTN